MKMKYYFTISFDLHIQLGFIIYFKFSFFTFKELCIFHYLSSFLGGGIVKACKIHLPETVEQLRKFQCAEETKGKLKKSAKNQTEAFADIFILFQCP